LAERTKGKIVYIGRLSPEKRPDQAIRALAKVVETVPDATLEFHGYPANQEILQQLKDLAGQLNVTDKVTFGDYITGDALAEAYKSAQVIVQTSVGEGFGMNLVEAFGYGVPAVSYDITYGTKELVKDGVNGYVVPAGAHGTMGERIAGILSDDGQWATLSEGAYKKAAEFSAKNMYAAWQDVM
jgi:poly(glycerol-phosphate) alpha-glucosyltransferase